VRDTSCKFVADTKTDVSMMTDDSDNNREEGGGAARPRPGCATTHLLHYRQTLMPPPSQLVTGSADPDRYRRTQDSVSDPSQCQRRGRQAKLHTASLHCAAQRRLVFFADAVKIRSGGRAVSVRPASD